MIRLIGCFDFDCSTVEEAYRELRKEIAKTNLFWETSDEAYDDNGELIDEFELNKAISNVLRGERDSDGGC